MRSRQPFIRRLLALTLAVALAACTRGGEQGEEPTSRAYLKARRAALVDAGEWTGTVRSTHRVEIRADRRIKMKRVVAENLSTVKRGDLLVEVDRSEIEKHVEELTDRQKALDLEMSSAAASLKIREHVVERRRQLAAKGIVAQKDLEEAERDLAIDRNTSAAKALEHEKAAKDLKEAAGQLAAANFYAPIDGTVSNLPLLGAGNDEVQPSALVAVVSDPHSQSLLIDVDETQRLRLKLGQPAAVTLEALPGKALTAKVADLGLTPKVGSGPLPTYGVRLDFSGPVPEARDGFRGTAKVEFDRVANAVVVPLAALRQLDGTTAVATATRDGGSPVIRKVEVGLRTDSEAEIKAGVTDGQFVVVDP